MIYIKSKSPTQIYQRRLQKQCTFSPAFSFETYETSDIMPRPNGFLLARSRNQKNADDSLKIKRIESPNFKPIALLKAACSSSSPQGEFKSYSSLKHESQISKEVLERLETRIARFENRRFKDSASNAHLKRKVCEWGQIKARLHEEFQLKQDLRKYSALPKEPKRNNNEKVEDHSSAFETALNDVRRIKKKAINAYSRRIDHEHIAYSPASQRAKALTPTLKREIDVGEILQIKQRLARKGIKCDLREISMSPTSYCQSERRDLPKGGENLLKYSQPCVAQSSITSFQLDYRKSNFIN